MSTAGRVPAAALGAVWVAGLLLALVNQEVDAVTTPVFLVLAAAYVAGAGIVLHRAGAHRRGALGVLVAAPVALFAIAGHTGAPSGDDPAGLVTNSAVLLVVAVALVLAAGALVLGHRRSTAAGVATLGLLALVLGSAGYLVNLAGRFAVVLSGLAERQAAVEERSWVAAEYLRGLPPVDDLLALVLTWMDIVQLGYVVTAYAATGALARLLTAEAVVDARTGRVVERAAWAGAGLLAAAVTLALALPHEVDAVPAGLAFALSIPFMTTLLPFALAASALRRS